MKKQKILSIIASVGIGLAFSVALSYAATLWTLPSTTAPGGNVAVPVNITTNNQVKTEGLSVNTFNAQKDSVFEQRVFFRGLVNGGGPGAANPSLKIGGALASGSSVHTVIANVQGLVTARDELGSSELVNSAANKLCSDVQGHVIFCTASAPIKSVVWANESTNLPIDLSVDGVHPAGTPSSDLPSSSSAILPTADGATFWIQNRYPSCGGSCSTTYTVTYYKSKNGAVVSTQPGLVVDHNTGKTYQVPSDMSQINYIGIVGH